VPCLLQSPSPLGGNSFWAGKTTWNDGGDSPHSMPVVPDLLLKAFRQALAAQILSAAALCEMWFADASICPWRRRFRDYYR